jgi:hypothetical protein
MTIESLAGVAEGFAWSEEVANSLIVREPIGVVGAIVPWNFPIQQIVIKVVPALLAGNTVVLKPAEVAPLAARILAEVAAEAGLPAGVLNVVHGTGQTVGEAISAHPGIDMVSFTGSTRAGKRVSAVASETVKRVALISNWKGWTTSYWLNLGVASITDIGFIICIIVSGYAPLWPGLQGPVAWSAAVFFWTWSYLLRKRDTGPSEMNVAAARSPSGSRHRGAQHLGRPKGSAASWSHTVRVTQLGIDEQL